MNNSTQREEMLMRYLDGEMSEGEKADFEKQLTSDEVLRTELENLLIAREAVKSFGLKNQVEGIHKEMMEEMKKTGTKQPGGIRRLVRIGVSVAASILLIAAAYFGYTYFSVSAEKLYAENYIFFEPDNMRNVDSTAPSAIEKAYKEKNFAEVIRLDSTSVTSANDVFLSGIAYLEMNDPAKAEASFLEFLSVIEESKSSVLKDAAEYYLALTYLKMKSYDRTIELMTSIRNNFGHTYKERFSRNFIRKVKLLQRK